MSQNTSNKTSADILKDDVKEIVNAVIKKFPFPIEKLLRPHADRLVNSIVRVSDKFVDAKMKEHNK